MAPLNWDLILNVSLNDTEDDENTQDLDYLYNQLSQFDPSGLQDIARLQRLFLVTQHIMKLKTAQLDVAMEELEEVLKEGVGRDHGKKDEILGREDAYHEVNKVKKEVKRLKTDLREKEQELQREKQSVEKYIELYNESDKERRMLQIEVSSLQSEVQDKFNQIDQLETAVQTSKNQKDTEKDSKLKEKNFQICQLLNEIQEAEAENAMLKSNIEDLRTKLNDAVHQMEKTTDDYITKKKELAQSETLVQSLVQDKEILKGEINDFRKLLRGKTEEDDEIMVTVSKRVEEWKKLLLSKEEMISKLEALIQEQQSKITALSVNTENTTLTILRKTVEEKDQQIEVLTKQLQQATHDIEENTSVIENLTIQVEETEKQSEKKPSKWIEVQQKLRENSIILKKTQEMLDKVEDEAKQKDKELTDAVITLRKYELGEYGLAEAVAEIKDCKAQIYVRDKEIEDLTQQLNEMKVYLEELEEENLTYRYQIDCDSVPRVRPPRLAKPRKSLTLLQEEVDRLQDENVDLKQKLRKLAKESSKRPEKSPVIKREHSTQVSPHFDKIEETLQSSSQFFKADHYMDQIYELEEENRDLQQGMVEILNALKQHNGNADVILECPSLEKVIQLMKARYKLEDNFELINELSSVKDENRRLKEKFLLLEKENIYCRQHPLLKEETEKLEKDVHSPGKESSASKTPKSHSEQSLSQVTIQETEDRISQLEKRFSEIELENFKQVQELKEKNTLITVKDMELAAVNKELQYFRKLYQEEKGRVDSQSLDATLLGSKVSEYQAESLKLQQQISEKNLLIDRKDVELSVMSKELQHLKDCLQKFKGSKVNYEMDTNPMENRITELQADNLKLQEQLHDKTLLTNKQNSDLQALSKELQSSKDFYQELINSQKKASELSSMLLAKEKIIQELKSVIPSQEKFESLPGLDYYHLKRSLKVAEVTVASLQAQLNQKENSLSKYREMLENMKKDVAKDKSHYLNELQIYHETLINKHEASIQNLQEAAAELQKKPSFSALIVEQLNKLNTLEESLSVKQGELTVANRKLKDSEFQIARLKQENEHLKKFQESGQRSSVQNASEDDEKAYFQQELAAKEKELKDKKEEIDLLCQELAIHKSSSELTPSSDLKNLVLKLRMQVDDKEKQLQTLSQDLSELKLEITTAPEKSLSDERSEASSAGEVQELKDTLKEKDEQISKLKLSMKSKIQKENYLDDELQRLKEENDENKALQEKLRREKDDLLQRIKLLRKAAFGKKSNIISSEESERTRQRSNSNLEVAEKPYEELEKLYKSKEKTARWEEAKKWQQTVERLKIQLKERNQKLETLEKINGTLRMQVLRLEKQKYTLDGKLKNLHLEKESHKSEDESSSLIAELQKQITDLKLQVEDLQANPESELSRLKLQNRSLQQKIHDLEKELMRKSVSRKVVHVSPVRKAGSSVSHTEDSSSKVFVDDDDDESLISSPVKKQVLWSTGVEKLASENKILQKTLAREKHQADILSKENEKLRQEVKDLSERLTFATRDDETKESLRFRVRLLEDQLKYKDRELGSLFKDFSQIWAGNKETETLHKALIKENFSLRSELKALQLMMERKEELIIKLQTELAHFGS